MSYKGNFNILNSKSYADSIYFQKSNEGNAPPPAEYVYMVTEDDKSMLTENNLYMVTEV